MPDDRYDLLRRWADQVTLQETAALIDDIQAAILPYVDDDRSDDARQAARIAVQALIESGALELE